jgi:hypothetical protein
MATHYHPCLLFNIVADMLAIIIEYAKADGEIKGVSLTLLMVDYLYET